MTFGQAAAALQTFRAQLKPVAAESATRAMRIPLKLAVTKYMEGLGRGKNAEPPNPPPGPLGIRTGRLRRAVRILEAEVRGDVIVFGLYVDLDLAPYGGIHELGGQTRAHPIAAVKAKALAFAGIGPALDGEKFLIFRRRVQHPGSTIPARPYMRPAMVESQSEVIRTIEKGLATYAVKLLRGAGG